ncbi:DNA-binding response regulator [Nocardioides aromaticivorans]|uniref:DNA-binding response regulator n=1 Tax=Nocardioides aromaticivorans TaxID=200618 RepID=A0ABX7PIL9_9ACTN|nr:response regulator transcription factor [Nocardioides aromaticivorans]QSR25754.1 DNA-binding response regulator [Nocardioides aromaticivorans]
MIRVVLADDHDLVRLGITAVLSEQPDISVCGVAATGEDAVAQAHEQSPDVVLLDLTMPGAGGLAAAAEIVAADHAVRALILTGHTEPELIRAAFAAGATGYVFKDADVGQLVEAVRAVHRGEVWLSPEAAGALAGELRDRTRRSTRRGHGPRRRAPREQLPKP